MFKKIVQLELSQNKQNFINIVTAVINISVTAVISFFLTPYIVDTLGAAANGFVNLANNFISYATLVKTALDSMGSRFIMMAYYKGEHEKVKRYYSSLLFGDVILGVTMAVLSAAVIWNLEKLLNVPEHLVGDVKLLFALVFANFIISTVINAWSTAPYIKNKLYLTSSTAALSVIIRALIILALFVSLDARVSFVGVGTLAAGIMTSAAYYFYKRSLFPDLHVRAKDFSWRTIWELVSSGIWNSISSLGSILTNGLDLVIANLFVGPTEMGVLSVSKTMPAFVLVLNESVGNAFTPSLIIDYAKKQNDNIVKTIRQASKILSIMCALPAGFLFVYGKEFYALWQPTQKAESLYLLTVIALVDVVVFSGMRPLHSVFTVVNKVRQSSLATIVTGVVSTVITLLMLKFTNFGIFAIAGVSVACCFVRNLVFIIPFSAKYLGLKITTFYCVLLPSVAASVIVCICGALIKTVIPGTTWISLIAACAVLAVAGACLASLLILNRADREYLFSVIKSRLKRTTD